MKKEKEGKEPMKKGEERVEDSDEERNNWNSVEEKNKNRRREWAIKN